MKKIVIALGGNAILEAGQEATYENQYNNVEKTSSLIASLVKEGYKLVINHGNGPQVGNLLLQNDLTEKTVPSLPLYILTAETQGFIGQMLQESLENKFMEEGIKKEIACLLTRVEVSKDDPAFLDPTKPVGRFYNEEEYKRIKEEKSWQIKKDSNRGYRRVVYSPKPISIVEKDTIKSLLDLDRLVIAGGGGGIPMVRENNRLKSIEAVIDKDLTSCKMAELIDADILMILTDVDHVFINYGKESEKKLTDVSVQKLEEYLHRGEFAKGSMLPKVEAALEFAKLGKVAYITSLDKAKEALEGRVGTRVSL